MLQRGRMIGSLNVCKKEVLGCNIPLIVCNIVHLLTITKFFVKSDFHATLLANHQEFYVVVE